MCMPTPSNVAGFGYSWGFTSSADLTKGEVEVPSSLSYTLGNTVSPETTLTVMSHKSPQVQEKVGTVAVQVTNSAAQVTRVVTTPVTARRAMFVLNEAPTHTINRVSQQNQTATIQTANLTAKPFMTPIGPIQLTAEECNEILMKRALQAGIATPVIDASQLNHTLLNGTLKGLADTPTQQTQTEAMQTTQVHPQHLLHTKQEPGTANNSPKTVYSQTEILNTNTMSNATPVVKERPYSCEECGKSFLLKHHLTTHARVHTGERPHVCGHCGKAFARKHCLNTHLLLHSADRPYRCHECKMAFTLKHHLVTHSRVHSRERPFICGECGRGFPLKRHLVTHSKYHAGERPYVCNDCGESFAQKDHLVMHSRFHGSLSPFVCSECGAAYARKFQLVNHGRVHGKVPHACPVCGKEFLQKRTLAAHMKLHTGAGVVACLECGEAFKCKAELMQHCKLTRHCTSTSTQQQQQQQQQAQQQAQQQQAQQQAQQQQQQQQQTVIKQDDFKPQIVQVIGADGQIVTEKATPGYACPECGSCFNTKEALSLHVRLHAGDRTCVTDLCALTAALQPGLVAAATHHAHNQPIQIISSTNPNNVVHTQVIATNHHITPPRPKIHFCVDCGKGFAAKHGLLAHHRRHPDGSCTLRTHVCDQCGKAFFQKNHLMLHQRQHMDLPPKGSQSQVQQQTTLQQQQQQQQAAQQVQQQVQQQHQQQQQVQHQNNLEMEQQDHQQPTHIQVVTNRSGQVIGNQIVVGRRLVGSQLHIVGRDGKPLTAAHHKPRHHTTSGELKEVGGLVLSTGRGTGLIKYEISIPPPASVVQVQQLD